MADGDSLAEIAPGFFWTALKRPDALRTSSIASSSICYSIDEELVRFYAAFAAFCCQS